MHTLSTAVSRALIHSFGAGLISFSGAYARESAVTESSVTISDQASTTNQHGTPNIIVDTDATYGFSNPQCALVEAITNANNGDQTYADCAPGLPGADVIGFDPALAGATIELYPTMRLSSDITITGLGSPSLTLSGSGLRRHFYNTSISTSTITGLTLTNGYSSNAAAAILNDGTLTLDDVTISNNSAASFAAAIENRQNLIIRQSTISNNTATNGGAIVTLPGSATQIDGSTIANNSSSPGGGAAGIIARGLMNITNSTISGNSGSMGTVNGMDSSGGISMVHATIAHNEGGVRLSGDGTNTMTHSIIANNAGSDCQIIEADMTDFNLDSDGTCENAATNHITADPLLGPLASNGGNTPTHKPAQNSPVIDAITEPCVNFVDQRLVFRPEDGDEDGTFRCDIGSVELRPDSLFNDGFE